MDNNNNMDEEKEAAETTGTENAENTENGENTVINEKTGLFSKKKKEKKTLIREVFDWVEIVALSLSFVLLTFSYVARQARVEGPSMQDTFYEGQSIVISNLFYTPKQGDIVVFQVPKSQPNAPTYDPIIKRVIAVDGQSVFINFDTWTVYVYEDPDETLKTESEIIAAGIKPLDEPYIENMRSTFPAGTDMRSGLSGYTYPMKVEEGKIFCMGDNRKNSSDSRSTGLGPIDTRYVLGKVLFRIYPFSINFD